MIRFFAKQLKIAVFVPEFLRIKAESEESSWFDLGNVISLNLNKYFLYFQKKSILKNGI